MPRSSVEEKSLPRSIPQATFEFTPFEAHRKHLDTCASTLQFFDSLQITKAFQYLISLTSLQSQVILHPQAVGAKRLMLDILSFVQLQHSYAWMLSDNALARCLVKPSMFDYLIPSCIVSSSTLLYTSPQCNPTCMVTIFMCNRASNTCVIARPMRTETPSHPVLRSNSSFNITVCQNPYELIVDQF